MNDLFGLLQYQKREGKMKRSVLIIIGSVFLLTGFFGSTISAYDRWQQQILDNANDIIKLRREIIEQGRGINDRLNQRTINIGNSIRSNKERIRELEKEIRELKERINKLVME